MQGLIKNENRAPRNIHLNLEIINQANRLFLLGKYAFLRFLELLGSTIPALSDRAGSAGLGAVFVPNQSSPEKTHSIFCRLALWPAQTFGFCCPAVHPPSWSRRWRPWKREGGACPWALWVHCAGRDIYSSRAEPSLQAKGPEWGPSCLDLREVIVKFWPKNPEMSLWGFVCHLVVFLWTLKNTIEGNGRTELK